MAAMLGTRREFTVVAGLATLLLFTDRKSGSRDIEYTLEDDHHH